jgi:hypothetical protein
MPGENPSLIWHTMTLHTSSERGKMTVRRSDVRVGDRGGDPGLPAAEVSPPPSASTERAPLGRFWALAVEDSNSSSKAEEG